jgi:peptide subunit release factor 1 (eRF1)
MDLPLDSTLARLAALPQTELPFLSAYVDLTPELDAGTRPYGGGDDDAPLKSWRRSEAPDRGHVRPGVTRMRDLLREHDHLFLEDVGARDSYDADKERITAFLEDSNFDNAAQGVAIFACAGANIWQVEELPVCVETRLLIGDRPKLYPLLRLHDEYERFALVIADGEKSRIYVVAMGKPEREEVIEGQEHNRTQKGGWSQKRYQRRVDNAISDHIRNTCERLERLVAAEDIGRIVLGGDAIAYTEFKNHLSDRTWEKVVAVENLDIRIAQDEAIQRAMQAVMETEAADARDLARLAKDEVLEGNLGAAGEKAVRYALEQGAVDILVIHPNYGNEESREHLTQLAVQTAATVEFVEDSEDLTRMGGVAAILRWRPEDLPVPKAVANMEQERDSSNLPEEAKATAV